MTEISDLLIHRAGGEAAPTVPLVRLLPSWQLPPVTAWAVFPERRLMPAKTRAFIGLLEQLFNQCRPVRQPPVEAG